MILIPRNFGRRHSVQGFVRSKIVIEDSKFIHIDASIVQIRHHERADIFLFERGGGVRKAQEFMEELKLARTENRLGVYEFNG